MKSDQPKYTRKYHDPTKEENTTDTDLATSGNMKLPDDWYGHDHDDEVGDNVQDSGTDGERLEVETTAWLVLVPHIGEGDTLKDANKGRGEPPEYDENGDTPNGDPEVRLWTEGTMIKYENGQFDEQDGKGVYQLEGQ